MTLTAAERDGQWRLLAIAASVALHLLAVAWLTDRTLIADSARIPLAPQTAVRLNFAPPVISPPQPVAPPEPREPPQPEPKPIVESNPPPKPKPTPKPRPKPLSKPKPVRDPAPIRPTDPPGPQSAETAPTLGPVPEPSRRPTDPEQTREAYLSRLLVLIEEKKFYPRPARKLGIEGTVTVSFVLMKSGILGDLKVSGGHKLLRKAAHAAVEDAIPFPEPPADLALPLPVSFRMAFHLD